MIMKKSQQPFEYIVIARLDAEQFEKLEALAMGQRCSINETARLILSEGVRRRPAARKRDPFAVHYRRSRARSPERWRLGSRRE